MKLTLDNDRLRTLIPNIIHEVEGETPLYEKLLPWLSSATIWMEQNILSDYQPEGAIYSLAEKIIVYKAFADALPSLDVTLSPAGFAVINTDGRAPASKERVERLILSLNTFVDANLAVLIRELHHSPEWAGSSIGRWFRATFMPDFDFVTHFRIRPDFLSIYKAMRAVALTFEQKLSELYLGHDFLASLRSSYPKFENEGEAGIFDMIQSAELKYLNVHISDKEPVCPTPHEIWYLARPIIAQLNYWPELKEKWLSEMGEKIQVKPFKNSVKGGFYF